MTFNISCSILHQWKTMLLIAPPSVAFLYAASATGFLAFWRESTISSYLPAILPHLSFSIAVTAYVMHDSSNDDDDVDEKQEDRTTALLVEFAVVLLLSGLLIRHTRVWQVVGGREPEGLRRPRMAPRLHATDNQGHHQQAQRETTSFGKALVPSPLKGKIVVVTGANAGIGRETVRQLAIAGAERIVMACRSLERAQQSRNDLIRDDKSGIVRPDQLELLQLDLSSIQSVQRAAAELAQRYPQKIDILINNAGLMMGHQVWTADGMELTMQANHLGHYLWTRLLLPHMTPAARILIVTSCTYRLATAGICLDDLFCQYRRPYSLFGQYAQTKLANILFCRELARRYPSLHCHSVHPGMVRTDVVKNLPWLFRYCNTVFAAVLATLQKTPSQGAWCTVHVATTDALPSSGSYWVNQNVQELLPFASDEVAGRALWELSAKLVGLK